MSDIYHADIGAMFRLPMPAIIAQEARHTARSARRAKRRTASGSAAQRAFMQARRGARMTPAARLCAYTRYRVKISTRVKHHGNAAYAQPRGAEGAF